MAKTIHCDLCGREIRTVGVNVSLIRVAGEPEYGETRLEGDWCVPCHAQRVNQDSPRPDFDAAYAPLGGRPATAADALNALNANAGGRVWVLEPDDDPVAADALDEALMTGEYGDHEREEAL